MTDWMNSRNFDKLLSDACKAAAKHAELSGKITDAFDERYGTNHSHVGDDWLIEALDYGAAAVDRKTVDARMAAAGHPFRKSPTE